ncbi:MAG: DUF3179 domain-containing protein [Gemmatimonadaceae bacterium]
MRALLQFASVVCILPTHLHAQMDAEWRTDFTRRVVPLTEIVSGGPPKDGIPSLDKPRFETIAQAGRWLADREPVIVVEHGNSARAYPLQILVWHEIVNDRIGDMPIAVTFCPLCNTALVFDRRHAGRTLDFGTTGRLRHSDLVMYDRQTESWWQQATGEGLVGTHAGDTLRMIASQTLSWRDVRLEHPTALVLSRRTGYRREYGRNPYSGYDAPEGSPIRAFFSAKRDERLPAMERVVAVRVRREAVAYPFSALRDKRVANDVVGAIPIVVFWTTGTASALDRDRIAEGRDVGASGAFDRRIQGRTLTFEWKDGVFRDTQTGSTWTLSGRAVKGPLLGTRLTALPAGDYFWFAWAVFRPDTRVWR